MEFLLVVGAFVVIVLMVRRKDRSSELESRIDRLEAQMATLQERMVSPSVTAPIEPPPEPAPADSPAPAPVLAKTVAAPDLVPTPDPPGPAPAVAQVSPPPSVPVPPMREAPALQPSLLSRFLGDNPVVRLGLVVFLLGVSFLIRQVALAGLFPPEARLGVATLVGTGLLWFGWKSRISRPHFALPLQGGALGILFLVLFAAFRLYQFIPAELALGAAVLLLAVTGTLAVVQDSATLAYFGMAAGFAAPLLLSSGSGNHIGLFIYYALLDAAIFGVAWFRSWRSLHVTAFLATYLLGASWGLFEYRSEHFLSCEIFVWVYYALFSGTGILFARRAYQNIFGYVDGTLFFGVPMATLALQYQLFDSAPWPMAWTSAVMALHNFAMALWVWSGIRSGRHPHLRVMAETLSVLGVSFASLAVPLAVSGPTTALVWAVEGAGLVFLGLRQARKWSLAMGMFLALAASVIQWGVWRPDSVGTVVVALSLWICAWLLGTRGQVWKIPQALAVVFLGWMLAGVSHDAWRLLGRFEWSDGSTQAHLTLAVACGVALLSTLGAWILRFPAGSRLWWPVTGAWFLMVLGQGTFMLFSASHSLLSGFGWLTHLAFVPCLGVGLFLMRNRALQSSTAQDGLQAILLHGLLWQNFAWFWDGYRSWDGNWSLAMGLMTLVVPLWVLGIPKIQGLLSFLSPRLYRSGWIAPWWLGACGLLVVSLFLSASSGVLFWIPLLNPLDLGLFLGLWALARLPATATAWTGLGDRSRRSLLLLVLLGWTGATLNRCFHHYGGVEWEFQALWDSRGLQAGWSLLLTTQALSLMLVAARRKARMLWVGGAVILAVAVFKLFLVDLSGHGTVARIVSFLGMGALMVAIGYFSPLPPVGAAPDLDNVPQGDS
ncbi:MAG: hypothetical protein RL318_2149 [Fibrobacterota bacterium]